MSPHGKFTSLFRPALVGCILIAVAWGLRASFLERKEWNLDEGSTFTMAQQILAGDVVYRDAADNRAPLVPYLKAAVFAIFGDWNVHAVHVLLALGMGVVALLLWDLCRRLGESETGIGAAVCFSLLSFLLPGTDALAAHTEWFVVIFSTAGFWLFAASVTRGRLGRGILMGVCFGASALCKQPGLLDGGIAGLCALALATTAIREERRRLLTLCAGMLIGVLLWVALTILYFWHHHALRDLFYYVWTYNSTIYVPAVPLSQRLGAGRLLYDLSADHAPGIGLLAAIGILFVVFRCIRTGVSEPRKILPLIIVGWTGTGVIATMLSGRSFTHYGIQAIPGLSLAAGWTIAQTIQVWRLTAGRRLWRLAVAGMSLAMFGWISRDAVHGWRAVKPQEDAAENRLISLVRQNSRKNERIFVWGYYPTLYLMAERLPSSRFIYTNYLTGLIPWTNIDPLIDTISSAVPGSWENLAQDLQAKPPALIVDTVSMRGYTKYPLSRQPILWPLILKDYAQVGVGDVDTRGMRLFRRIEHTTQLSLPPSQVDSSIELSGFQSTRQDEPPALRIKSERHAQSVQIFAADRCLASLPLASERPVDVVFYPQLPSTGSLRVVLVTGDERVASESFDFAQFAEASSHRKTAGPRLHVGQTPLNPTKVETLFAPIERHGDRWRLSAPAKLEYECPASVEKISFTHQVVDPQSMLSDGYDVLVEFLDPKGKRTPVFLERLHPRTVGKDQLRRGVRFSLPVGHPDGHLILSFLNGENNSPDADRIDMSDLFARDIGPSIVLGPNRLEPIHAESAEQEAMSEDADGHWSADAPTVVEWRKPAELAAISLHYGIRDGAFTSTDGHSDGVDFTITFKGEDGTIQTLFNQLLAPYNHPEHRGEQVARVTLPLDRTGTILLQVGPGPANDRTWDWAWVGAVFGHEKTIPTTVQARDGAP